MRSGAIRAVPGHFDRVVIARKDLGVRWVVDTATKAYRETPLNEGSGSSRQGSATYAEMRTLEVLKSTPFQPGISTAEDSFYHGFADADEFLKPN